MTANVSVRCMILSEWRHDDVWRCVLRCSRGTASFTSVAPSLQWKQKCAADRYETPDRKHGCTELLTCQHADQLKGTWRACVFRRPIGERLQGTQQLSRCWSGRFSHETSVRRETLCCLHFLIGLFCFSSSSCLLHRTLISPKLMSW